MAKLTHEDAQKEDGYNTPTVEGTDEPDEIDTSKSKSNFQINANDGDDTIISHLDTVYGGEGNDTILDEPSFNTSKNSNYYYYRSGHIYGEAGNDQITINNMSYSGYVYGGTGNDTVNILLGSAYVYGQEGHDSVMGGDNSDHIYGGTGEDILQGAGGGDHIYGGGDDDTLYGNNGNDELIGNDGDDYLSGEGGRDELYGGSGNDTLYGGMHNDTMNGGSGEDTVFMGVSTSDVTGYDNLNGVITFVSDEGIDRIQDVEYFQFSNKTVALDELEATFGHVGYQRGVQVKEDYQTSLDTLSGTDGNDEIYLSGYSWNGTAPDIAAKAGNDIIFTYSGRSVTVDGGEGLDTLVTSFNSSAVGAFVETNTALMILTANSTLKISNIEELEFTDFVFTIDHFKSFFADFELSADTILGSHANDTLGGTLLDDKFYSGTGQDSIDGNEGDDTVIFSFDSSQVSQFTLQNNQVTIRTNDSNYSVSNIEHFQFSDKAIDLDDLTNTFYRVNTSDQTFDGTDANDDLKGGLGSDKLNGMAGDDTLYGDEGTDEIDGGAGTDTVVFDQFIKDVSSYTNNNGTVTLNLNNNYGYYYNNQDIIKNVEYFNFADKTVAFDELDEVFLRVNTADQTFIADNENRDITGGKGYDTAVFDFAISDVETYSSTTNYSYYTSRTVVFNGETYSLESIESYQFSDRTVKATDLNKQLSSVRTDDQYLDGSHFINNVISGGLGNDSIITYDGGDTISGGSGDDIINAGSGNDNVDAGEGDDTIRLNQNNYWTFPDSQSSGNNVVDAGNGNDLIYLYDNPGVNNIDGGEGDDTVEFEYSSTEITQVKIVDNRATFKTQNTTNTFSNVEKFKFGILIVSYSELSTYFSEVFEGGETDEGDTASKTNIINGTDKSDTITGTDGNDTINAGAGIDVINSGDGDDLIKDAEIGETIDGGDGDDTVQFNIDPTSIITAVRNINGDVNLVTDNGSTTLRSVENILFSTDNLTSTDDLVAEKNVNMPAFASVIDDKTIEATPEIYTGDVKFLEYQLFGDSDVNIITGSAKNDFLNLLGGDDAANGADGNDVLDGGTGSNFLIGGAGSDTFYLDGRSSSITWSTIKDFNGDQVNIWGWIDGVSKLHSSEDNAGAVGAEGATFHYDLDSNGTIDTSITFSGLTLQDVPQQSFESIEGLGYILFS